MPTWSTPSIASAQFAASCDFSHVPAREAAPPTLRITGSMNGQHVYMLYLAVPGADSPAILINYRPPGKGVAADDAAWQRFVDSMEVAKNQTSD